jgi:hypothetical protein
MLAVGWLGGGLASLNGDAGGYFYSPATAGRGPGSVASPWPTSWGQRTPATPPSVAVAASPDAACFAFQVMPLAPAAPPRSSRPATERSRGRLIAPPPRCLTAAPPAGRRTRSCRWSSAPSRREPALPPPLTPPLTSGEPPPRPPSPLLPPSPRRPHTLQHAPRRAP